MRLHGIQCGVIPLQQAQCRPACLQSAAQPGRKRLCQAFDLCLQLWRIGHAQGLLRHAPDDLLHPLQQLLQAAPAPCARAHDRHAEQALQCLRVHADVPPGRLVQEVDAQHHARRQLQNLQREVEVALQACGVAYDDDGLRAAEAQKVAGDLLLGRARVERIGAGNVHQLIYMPCVAAHAARAGDRLARPVAGVLAHARQRVEHGALADVGVAGQRDQARAAQAHVITSRAAGSTCTARASSRRRAITAPRTR